VGPDQRKGGTLSLAWFMRVAREVRSIEITQYYLLYGNDYTRFRHQGEARRCRETEVKYRDERDTGSQQPQQAVGR
jgi:hypothetical protein